MARKTRGPKSGYTILVVDDQQETLASVQRLLEREGHDVLTADCGERALTLFREHEVHLLLVDYFMPRMTGEALVREIRVFDPFVQIILQTGYSGEKPPRAMLAELDIQGYHDKAEGPDALLLWVDVALKAHRLIRTLRERERLQAELVANVSHELRTPLSAISGYSELLIAGTLGTLPDGAVAPLRAVEQATHHLLQLVSDFLYYAKLEARVLDVDRQWVGFAQLLPELEGVAARLLRDKRGVSFHAECPGAPAGVITDPGKLRTILRNLLSNAAKFTRAGSIVLRITARDGQVQFAVRDTGPGIAATEVEEIFQPFRQLDGSVTRRHGGIGLGLALSRRLAQLLGGALEVESEPGVGSTFTLRLPAPVDKTAQTPTAAVARFPMEIRPAAVAHAA